MAIDELSGDIVSSNVASPISDAASRKSFRHLSRGVIKLQINFVAFPINIWRFLTNIWLPIESEARCPRWSFKDRTPTSSSSSSMLGMAIDCSWQQPVCFLRGDGGSIFLTRCWKRSHSCYVSWFSGVNRNRFLLCVHKRCGWQDGLASRRLRRLQSGRRACTSISTTGVLRSRLNLEVLFYETCRASDGVCLVVSAFTVQFKYLLICRVWRRIPAHFRLHYSELAEKTNVTAEDVNPTSRWV